jgi:hypothetical protein
MGKSMPRATRNSDTPLVNIPVGFDVESLTTDQVMLFHIYVVILSYMLSRIPQSTGARIEMDADWQVAVYVLCSAISRVRSQRVDPTSETESVFRMDQISTVIERPAVMAISDPALRAEAIDYVLQVVENFDALLEQFRTNLSNVSGDGFQCASCVLDVASWASLRTEPITVQSRVRCWMTHLYFPGTDLCMVHATSHHGVPVSFPVHKEMILFIKVAHIHLNMGYILFNTTGHLGTDLLGWLGTVVATFRECSSNFSRLVFGVITRLASEQHNPAIFCD